MDIDNFKEINDNYGHDAGDAVLKAMTDECLSLLRGFDLYARLGGDEFAVLLPHTGIDACIQTAERFRRRLEKLKIPALNSEIKLTVSIGMTAFKPDGDGIESFIKRADTALYESKKSGRNRVTVA